MSESIGNTGKGMKLHTKVLLGLVIGAVLGIAANTLLGPRHPWVEGVNAYLAGPVGAIFLNLLFMIVIPLVFASIALGVAGLGDLRRVGRVGTKATPAGASRPRRASSCCRPTRPTPPPRCRRRSSSRSA
jgi:Na+/H+-dicarboxylate symporter